MYLIQIIIFSLIECAHFFLTHQVKLEKKRLSASPAFRGRKIENCRVGGWAIFKGNNKRCSHPPTSFEMNFGYIYIYTNGYEQQGAFTWVHSPNKKKVDVFHRKHNVKAQSCRCIHLGAFANITNRKTKKGAFTQTSFVHSQNRDRVLANKELSAYAENITYLQNIISRHAPMACT